MWPRSTPLRRPPLLRPDLFKMNDAGESNPHLGRCTIITLKSVIYEGSRSLPRPIAAAPADCKCVKTSHHSLPLPTARGVINSPLHHYIGLMVDVISARSSAVRPYLAKSCSSSSATDFVQSISELVLKSCNGTKTKRSREMFMVVKACCNK